MPGVRARPYAGAADLSLLVDFARTVTAARWPGRTYWHVGDIVWRIVGGTDVALEDIHLWLDAGGLAGVVWLERPDEVQLDIRPGTPLHIAEEMLEWAENRWRALRDPSDDPTLTATALEGDSQRIALLERLGYIRTEGYGAHMRRGLLTPVPDATLTAGMRLRHATDADIEERVDLHRDAWSVWAPSRVTVAGYRRLRKAAGYEPALDVVLELPDGTLASYCICWLDEANGVGLFEPVGTRPAFKGRGFARAVVFEGLRRLRNRGMHTALVRSGSINERALALYQSCGFETIEREHIYTKPLT